MKVAYKEEEATREADLKSTMKGKKNKIRAVFKLQFHATQIEHQGWEIMMVSLVPSDIGKPTTKTDKVLVIGGGCYWRNPIYETARLYQDPRTGKIHDKLYKFAVSANGLAASAVIGEAIVNLSEYFNVVMPAYISLPLKPAKSGVMLHVTIQRMHADIEVRGSEELTDAFPMERSTINMQESNNWDKARAAAFLKNVSSIENGLSAAEGERKKFQSKRTLFFHPESSGNSDKSSTTSTISTAGSNSSGQHNPKENENISWNASVDSSISESLVSNNDSTIKKEITILDYLIMEYSDHKKSAIAHQIGKYGNQLIPQIHELELSELGLQNLIRTEGNHKDLFLSELNSLKGERDALKRECEELKASQKRTTNEVNSYKSHPFSKIPSANEEIKQELQYERSTNANLRLQLQKTQEANSELIFAVQDLEKLLEQEYKEISCINCSKISIKQHTEDDVSEINFTKRNSHVNVTECKELFETTSDGDNEQYQFDVLDRKDDRVKAAYSLEQKIEDIDTYKMQAGDLQMKMEKLALDYENLKQENNNLISKLGQAQQKENIQPSIAKDLNAANYLEDQVRNLRNELLELSKAHEAKLGEVMKGKLQLERRAAQAEYVLQLAMSNSASIAEKLQEEFVTLEREISSTFYMNEKLAIQALAEVNEMHLQKRYLESLLERSNEDFTALQHRYDAKLMELSGTVDTKTKEIAMLFEKLKAKSEESNNQKRYEVIEIKVLTAQILMLETKVKMLSSENIQLSNQMELYQRSIAKMEQLKNFNEQIEITLYETSLEKEMLHSKFDIIMEKAVKSEKDLQNLHQLVQNKDIIIKYLKSDVDILRAGFKDSINLSFDNKMENEKLRKQASHLKYDLRNSNDTNSSCKRKLKESASAVKSRPRMKITIARNKSHKPGIASQGFKDNLVLREKFKLVKANLMSTNTELEETRKSFLLEEKKLNHRIQELENSACQCKNQEEPKVKHNQQRKCANDIQNELTLSTEAIFLQQREEKAALSNYNQDSLPEMLNEMTLLKVNSKAMETDLKEMQQRYTEISLRFAEVEGERQQLVMIVRNLKNSLRT